MLTLLSNKTKEKISVLRRLDSIKKVLLEYIQLTFTGNSGHEEIYSLIAEFIKLVGSLGEEDSIYHLIDQEIEKRTQLHDREFDKKRANQEINFEIQGRISVIIKNLKKIFHKDLLNTKQSKKKTSACEALDLPKKLAYHALSLFKDLGDYYKAKMYNALFSETDFHYTPPEEVKEAMKILSIVNVKVFPANGNNCLTQAIANENSSEILSVIAAKGISADGNNNLIQAIANEDSSSVASSKSGQFPISLGVGSLARSYGRVVVS